MCFELFCSAQIVVRCFQYNEVRGYHPGNLTEKIR